MHVIRTAGYQVKEQKTEVGRQKTGCRRKKGKKEGWQCLRLAALWANVMVCGYLGRFVSFRDGLLRQGRDFLGYNCSVVDTDIINQAGPVGTRFHSRAGTDVQTVF